MSYLHWFLETKEKHNKLIEKLVEKNFTKEMIVEYFLWENLSLKEQDFCPLFAKNEKCHDIRDLNCLFCGCPYFRFDDCNKRQKSFCQIDSKKAEVLNYNGVTHLDCSKCHVPHSSKFILQHFSYDWGEVMKDCQVKET